ncbi:ABC transporter substrate-binding protein [Candidatus Nomurabacteria bacterium]|nr:ABC transporter substrate-binding protein [Candidatus Nomurabacteria bacterium]
MKKITFALIIVALLVSGCAAKTPKTETDKTIKIGSVLILSGEGAAWGTATQKGIELALKDINKTGIDGKKLDVIYEDSKGDAKTAVSAYNKLTKIDEINMIVGGTWSNTGLAMSEPAKQDKTIFISPSLGLADFNESSEYFFNTWPHDAFLSAKLADVVYAAGKRNVALLAAQQVWVTAQTQAFKSRFEQLGGAVGFLTEPGVETKDVLTDITKIKNDASLDAVVFTNGNYNLGVLYAQKLREFRIELPMYSITMDQKMIDAAQGAFDGLTYLTSLTPTDDFRKRFESTYNEPIDIGADSAYDAMMMLAEAIEVTDSTNSDTLAKYLNEITTWDGVSGKLLSDGKGGFTKDFQKIKVVGGKPVSIQ